MFLKIYWLKLWRAKLIWIAFGLVLVIVGCAFLASMFSGRQPATVALDVGISVAKLLLPLFLVLVMQELFSREFEQRYFLISLSYPNSRTFFLFSRFVFVITLLFAVLLLVALSLLGLSYFLSLDYQQASPVALGSFYWLTFAFIGLDFLILASVALLLAVVASTPSFVLLGTFGFMFIARSFMAIINLLNEGGGIAVIVDEDSYSSSLSVLSYFLPDLGALDVRNIALYGYIEFLPQNWLLLVLMSFIYIFVFLSLANYSLAIKRFK